MKRGYNLSKFVLSLLIMVSFLSACKNENNSITAKVYKDAKFDCADLDLKEEDFTKAGLEFGDSLNIEFSNGTKYEDVPYYNGYYVKTGKTVVVSYPKNDYVLIANNNSDLWSLIGLKDGDSVKITLASKGKYLATQNALGHAYDIDRSKYDSDEQFANFRSLKGGKLKDNFLYRGASPVDNSRGRAYYVDKLLEENNIQTIIDLADSDEDMQTYLSDSEFKSDYTKKLYENKKDILLSMSSNTSNTNFKHSFASGLRFLMENGGPAYIHCMEGKDRTGFVCLIIEALMGASYDEMCDDYMETYKNYFKITKENDEDKYNAIVNLYFNAFIEQITGKEFTEDVKQLDFSEYARNYLLSCDMSEEEIDTLVLFLLK